MAKTAEVRIRLTPALKRAAETAIAELGLYPTQAITLFYIHLAVFRQLPEGLGVAKDTGEWVDGSYLAISKGSVNEKPEAQAPRNVFGGQ